MAGLSASQNEEVQTLAVIREAGLDEHFQTYQDNRFSNYWQRQSKTMVLLEMHKSIFQRTRNSN